jgi:hypothetical protein
MSNDPIQSPAHYCHSPTEPMRVIEDWGLNFALGNVIKYVARADYKGSSIEDLKKAAWYLAREIKRRESQR